MAGHTRRIVRSCPWDLLGTERVYANVLRFRRTPVTLRVGKPFGPLQIDPTLRGKARRQRLDELADLMMQQIAALFPPECSRPLSQHGFGREAWQTL